MNTRPRSLSRFLALPLSAFLLLAGCITGPDGKQHVDTDRVSRLAGVAASIGAHAVLMGNPTYRPAFELAVTALTALIDAKNYDPAAFAAEMQKLPVDALNSKNGSLYTSVAMVVWDEAAHAATGLDQEALVAKTLLSVRDGLASALR